MIYFFYHRIMILPNRYRHLHLRQHLQRYLLFSIVCVSIPFATSYVVVRKEKDFLAFLTDVSQCGKYNALASVQGGKIGCECGNGRGVESSFHGLLKDQKPHCYSSADLGEFLQFAWRVVYLIWKGGGGNQIEVTDGSYTELFSTGFRPWIEFDLFCVCFRCRLASFVLHDFRA